MEFFFSIFFLLFYYIRPQDWVSGLSGMNLIQPIIGMWLLALFFVRSKPSPLSGLARTPHDWMMLLYLAYIVFIGDGALSEALPPLAFYLLTVQSVTTWERLHRYLIFWNGALIVVALFGVLSTVGIDITGAQDNYYTGLGRLAIGTWLHNNPNALCHAIVAALASSYVLYFWKGSVTSRTLIFPMLAGVTFYCAWLTQSKGGYIAGAGTLFVALILGRPKWVQILAIVVALTGGFSMLSFLPRMNEMGSLRQDEGVMGRILAWEMAQMAERNNPTGVGWKKYVAEIPWKENNQTVIQPISTHSSYVQIGADLGRYGLFLYLAVYWCAFRSVLVTKSSNTLEERCRRTIFLYLVALAISGWMINRQYHTEYFLLIAAAASFHRLKKSAESQAASEPESVATSVEKLPGEQIAIYAKANTIDLSSDESKPPPLWNRFGITDALASVVLTWFTLFLWDYLMKNV